MRSHLLTSAAMLMALLATAPVNAEEEAATTQTMDAGMAEAAAEQAAMEAEMATDAQPMQEAMEAEAEQQVMEGSIDADSVQTETADYIAPVEHGVAPTYMAPVEQSIMESGEATTDESAETKTEEVTTVREEVVGTQVEISGPAALPPQDMNIPVRGMHMDQVEQMYGKPMGINPPVGEPPITRWDYPGYAVYFEYSYVIQSVPK